MAESKLASRRGPRGQVQMMDVQEVAERLKVTPKTVEKLIDTGVLAAIDVSPPPADPRKRPKRCLRLEPAEVERFMRERAVQPGETRTRRRSRPAGAPELDFSRSPARA